MIAPTLPGSEYELRVPPSCVAGARLFADRKSLVAACKDVVGPNPVVAELGVFHGFFSKFLLDTLRPAALHLIDTFNVRDHIFDLFDAGSHAAYVRDAFRDSPTVHVHQGLSWEQLARFPDDTFDFVYVDADHGYHGVCRDIAVAHAKVRPGGVIQFNDYSNWGSYERAEYGVLRAVNEYVERERPALVGLSLDRSGMHDLAVRVRKGPRLSIVTPCSRPDNLHALAASIDFSKVRTWYIVYDTTRVPDTKRFADNPQVVELSCGDDGAMGNPQRNRGMDAVEDGLVYFLDDDNTVHPRFWELADRFRAGKVTTFNMSRSGASVLRGSRPVVGEIDTAQFVFDVGLARSKNIRFHAHRYEADGMFVQDLVAAHPDSWDFIDEIAATYNALRP